MRSLFLVAASWFAVVACACGKSGGPVSGASDTHCGTNYITTSQASCSYAGDGGMPGDMQEVVRFNTVADDDDCKYRVLYQVTPITLNTNATFIVTVLRKADGLPATGADARIEAFLSDTHPAPNANTTTTETSAGVYSIGPVRFDASGQWTVKFHFFESCFDIAEDSPHGHVSFAVDVP